MNMPSVPQLKRAVIIAGKLAQLEKELAKILAQASGVQKVGKSARRGKAKKTKGTMPRKPAKKTAAHRKR